VTGKVMYVMIFVYFWVVILCPVFSCKKSYKLF